MFPGWRHWPSVRRRRALVLSTVVIASIGGGGAFLSDVTARLPEPDAIRTLGLMANATVVYDAFDELVFTLFRERRLSVPLSEVSPDLIAAVIAIEDRRFYRHRGIDLIRIGGAALADLRTGRLGQGGSTITQQLARTSLLSRERTFRRKLAEVITAVRIEHTYTKNDILELYLNKVYFGDGFPGVEAAARGYFGKRANDVTLAEAALLAGLIQAPGRYSPTQHPERARERRDLVLRVMRETGIADARQAQHAAREPLQLQNGFRASPEFGAYFKAEVRRQLVGQYGEDQVYGEGLRVYTTLVPDVQRAAEAAVHQGLHRIETLPRYPHGAADDTNGRIGPDGRGDRLQAALIALDPQTGAVRAVVGGRQFNESPFNRATQAERQPGSAFKPFVVAAALERGITPVTRLTELGRPTPTKQGDWLPDDGAPETSELMLRAAVRVSSNRAAVRLLELTGIDRTVEYAERFALGPQPRVPSVALGVGAVTLQNLTAAYAAFANRGVVPTPTYIRRVERRDGTILSSAGRPPVPKHAVTSATAYIVSDLLRHVVDAGTGARVRTEGFLKPAAGKTGTTNDYKDAWFVGFTPGLATGVWIGFDRPRTIVPHGYASDLAAPVWATFMNAVGDELPERWLEPPADVVAVEVCALSGALARDSCRRVRRDDWSATRSARPTYVEYFAEGTENYCHLHRPPSPGRRLARIVGRQLETPLPPPPLHDPPPATPVRLPPPTAVSVGAVHDHVFGNCTGQLVVSQNGVRYETSHKDAFAVAYADLEQFEVDAVKRRLKIKPRGGRTYHFTHPRRASGELADFHAEAQQARTRFVAQDDDE